MPSSQGIRLDDIFSGAFFTSDGNLLDVLSEEDVGLNLTLPSISSSEGRAHTPFARYAVLGNSPDVTGGGGCSGQVEAFLRPRPGPTGRKF